MKQLIKVDRLTNWNCVDIELTNVCNYNCYYCRPSDWKPNDFLDCDKFIRFFDKIIKKDFKQKHLAIITGGEPTLHPQINDFLYYFYKNKVFVTLVSNGSKHLKWWEKNIKYIDKLILSYQLNSTILEDFIEKLKFLTTTQRVQINLSMLPDKFDECVVIANELRKINNVIIVPKILVDKFNKPRNLYTYTDDQLKFMKTSIYSLENFDIENKPTLTIFYYFDDGSIKNFPAHRIVSEELNKYKGWKCWKGVDAIRIVANGDLYLAGCDYSDKNKYGNINDNIKLPTEPTICNYDHCFCLTDIINLRKKRDD